MNITASQVAILRKLLEDGRTPVDGDPRPWKGLVAVGLIQHDEREAKLTAKGREFVEQFSERLASGRKTLHVATARRPRRKQPATATPPKRRRPRRTAPKSDTGSEGYAKLRAEIVARYEADLAALDRVIEIARAIEAQA